VPQKLCPTSIQVCTKNWKIKKWCWVPFLLYRG